ncbi:MAG: hypothetical protein LGR52_14530, partial [Candidatus Thiosymbion ectosymbiont of Robbea hypermnestra]|nr:hypothetical protein [Candidatus Thiosymbion ectosymbiont of Robbea hypermnestra]
MNGMDGNDRLYGGDGKDTLSGGAGNDYLSGQNGNDVLNGGVGDDVLDGGLGDDIYHWGTGDGSDVLIEARGGGIDRLKLTDLNAADITLTQSLNQVRNLLITNNATGEQITLARSYRENGTGSNEGVQYLEFADGTVWDQNTMRAHAVLRGTDGNDVIRADNDYGERIEGGAGNDTIYGNGGDDAVNGMDGNDRLYGGDGKD